MARCVCGTVVCVRSYQWQLLQHLYYTVWQGVCVWYCSVCTIISMAVITTLILYCMARKVFLQNFDEPDCAQKVIFLVFYFHDSQNSPSWCIYIYVPTAIYQETDY